MVTHLKLQFKASSKFQSSHLLALYAHHAVLSETSHSDALTDDLAVKPLMFYCTM